MDKQYRTGNGATLAIRYGQVRYHARKKGVLPPLQYTNIESACAALKGI